MKILVLAGPTAAGKTAAAMRVADLWPGVRLVSADAMQVYRGMDIGTGKPTPAELARYPHACVDIRDSDAPYSAADFAADADAIIAEGAPTVIVGGTGFYLRALLVGLAPAPSADEALRAELEALDDPHAALARVDPVLAAQLHPNDRVRVIRGLEVHRLTGRPFSAIHQEHAFTAPRHPAVRRWLDRDDLDARIDARVLKMVEDGYVEEVRRLLTSGVDRDSKPMRSLGYRWMGAHLLDDLPLAEAVRLTQRDTRRFARKQRGMLRSIGGFEQIDAEDWPAVRAAATEAFGPPQDEET
ncbi:MAG: tRNA (adenosine(37)-N6)-dimethylallyltransferase MiaA [Alphaproteobacteria bacterium]|nr:tRNA (adenosine(37)-N6)-dimethylallyltransferase MiaA [Alphaproteobacteria bacterium]